MESSHQKGDTVMSSLLKTVSKQTKETLYVLRVLMRKAVLPQCTKEIKTLLQFKAENNQL